MSGGSALASIPMARSQVRRIEHIHRRLTDLQRLHERVGDEIALTLKLLQDVIYESRAVDDAAVEVIS